MHPFSYKVFLSRLSIYINTLKKYFFVCDERHPFEYASKAHSFNNLKQKCLRIQILILRDYSSLTNPQIVEILTGNRQSSPRGPASTEKRHTSQEQQEVIFDLPPPPRDKTASSNSPPPGPKGWTCPGVARGGWQQVKLNHA